MRTLSIFLSLLTFIGGGCRFVETKVEEKQYTQIGQAPETARPPEGSGQATPSAVTPAMEEPESPTAAEPTPAPGEETPSPPAEMPTSPAEEEVVPAPTPAEPAPAEGQAPKGKVPPEEEKPAEKPAVAPPETPTEEAPTEPAKPEQPTEKPAPSEKKAPSPQVRVSQAGREAAGPSPAEAWEEEEPVPGGGVEGRPPVGEGMTPRVRSGGAAREEEPETEAALHQAEEETGRAPEGEKSPPERRARAAGRLTPEAEEPPRREADQRRAEAQAAQKAWDEAEAERETQRQATLRAVEFHLAQAEGFLGEEASDLKGALRALAGLRRSLGFLRSRLTPTALWHEVECALALDSEGQTDEAVAHLNRAIELAPPAKAPEESQAEAPAEEANQATDAEEKEGPEVEREDTENEANAAEPGEQAEPPEAPAETPAAEASAATPEHLRDQLLALVKKLEENEPQGREELAALLDQVTPSEAEELIDALTAEIDYAAAALNRASWAAARTELQSIRSNVERLKKLVGAEPEAEGSGLAPAPEESTEAEEESTKAEAESRFSFHPTTPSARTRLGVVGTGWMGGLGVLAAVGLWALRRRRSR